MRTVTVTEKYRAVQEGKMAKSVFLQQMKRQYPFFISQFDSFDSSVAILKNKGMLYEAKEEVYDKDYYKFSVSLSLEFIEQKSSTNVKTYNVNSNEYGEIVGSFAIKDQDNLDINLMHKSLESISSKLLETN